MEANVLPIDDQPISATFFDEGRWLSDFVTPDEPDIIKLWQKITKGLYTSGDRITACWDWVANQVKYKNFIRAEIKIEGKYSFQDDFWQTPAMCAKTLVGNCCNKAFLLASLLRNELESDQVYCVLGNLFNGTEGGHAWVEVDIGSCCYIVEATRNDVPMIITDQAERYQPVHYFNDKGVLAVPGRTVMTPFQACYSDWLRDYLQWSYIRR